MQRVETIEPELEGLVCALEIGVVGVASTCAARFLGLDPIAGLLAIFFTTTLTGQFLVSLLRR